MSPPPISLSGQEEIVRQLLVDVGTEIDAAAPDQEPIVLRFTGGWVRDKLLGIPSHDIDVGINRMTGFDFGNYLAGFLERNLDKYNIPPSTIHKIDSNPKKSKHLETATTRILGLDIDLVNLRSEAYNPDSRIPQMALFEYLYRWHAILID
jgi:tRNA nucleotidyltransferase (CCA-adding enzyme)